MKSLWKCVFGVSILTSPLLAGALLLEIGNPAGNPEAMKDHAALIVRTTSCHSPEKTTIWATAEGVLNGRRQSIPLKVISLSTPGTFAVTQEWPSSGSWVIKAVATNPEYQGYTPSVLVPVRSGSVQLSSAKHLFKVPTDVDIASALN